MIRGCCPCAVVVVVCFVTSTKKVTHKKQNIHTQQVNTRINHFTSPPPDLSYPTQPITKSIEEKKKGLFQYSARYPAQLKPLLACFISFNTGQTHPLSLKTLLVLVYSSTPTLLLLHAEHTLSEYSMSHPRASTQSQRFAQFKLVLLGTLILRFPPF